MGVVAMSRELGSFGTVIGTLVINTEKVSVPAGADLVIQLVRSPAFQASEASRKKLANLAMACAVRAELKSSRSTRDADIDVEVQDGHVLLRGLVTNEIEKRAVEQVVRGVKGLEKVESWLQVLGLGRGRRIVS